MSQNPPLHDATVTRVTDATVGQWIDRLLVRRRPRRAAGAGVARTRTRGPIDGAPTDAARATEPRVEPQEPIEALAKPCGESWAAQPVQQVERGPVCDGGTGEAQGAGEA
eukprot:COSAG02_NODE_2170_length_9599_cov_5.637789_12_plen_110_part_00